jgi:hypothetical protein
MSLVDACLAARLLGLTPEKLARRDPPSAIVVRTPAPAITRRFAWERV